MSRRTVEPHYEVPVQQLDLHGWTILPTQNHNEVNGAPHRLQDHELGVEFVRFCTYSILFYNWHSMFLYLQLVKYALMIYGEIDIRWYREKYMEIYENQTILHMRRIKENTCKLWTTHETQRHKDKTLYILSCNFIFVYWQPQSAWNFTQQTETSNGGNTVLPWHIESKFLPRLIIKCQWPMIQI